MKIGLTLLVWLISVSIQAQHSLIFDVPNTPELLKKNKVTEIHIREKTDNGLTITNKYFINDGYAYEHQNFDPYFMGDGSVMERSWRSKDTAGLVHYTRAIYTDEGVLTNMTHHYKNWFSSSNKLLRTEQLEWADYLTARIRIVDTLQPNNENFIEWRILNDDTLYMISDLFDGKERLHIYRTKVDGKWRENEKSISVFNNGKLSHFYRYSFGKLVEEITQEELEEKSAYGERINEEDHGLPVPDPFTEVFYVNDLEIESIKEVKKSKAKFILRVHYDQGKGGDPHYEVFDNVSGLLLFRFGKDKAFYTEFLYISSK